MGHAEQSLDNLGLVLNRRRAEVLEKIARKWHIENLGRDLFEF